MDKDKAKKENEKLIKKLDPLLLGLEIASAKKIIRFLKSTEKDIIGGIKGSSFVSTLNMELIVNDILYNKSFEFQKLIEGIIHQGGKFGQNQVYQDLKRYSIYSSLSLQDIHPKVSDEILNRKKKWAETKILNVQDKVSERLNDGYKKGLGIDEIASNISQDFKITQRQASTIARTEINGAKNEVAFSNLKELGVEYKEWSSSGDERVRPSHREVDGEIVKLNERFSNGLLYPHDPDGPADEVVNCRCSVLSYFE